MVRGVCGVVDAHENSIYTRVEIDERDIMKSDGECPLYLLVGMNGFVGTGVEKAENRIGVRVLSLFFWFGVGNLFDGHRDL